MTIIAHANGHDHKRELFAKEWEGLHRNVLTAVSRDLKTPIACIIGALEIYERTKEKLTFQKKNVLINTALQEAYRLDNFISNILDMAKLENNLIKIKYELCVMDLLLEDCLITLGYRLRECEISIRAIPATFPVTTDYVLLMRAICIVLDNAAKYCGPTPNIAIEYERLGPQVVIRIQDCGPGIPKNKLEDIFCKYTRYSAKKRHQSGTGLGLPICREIMRLLGGSIEAKNSITGKGSIFTLTFTG